MVNKKRVLYPVGDVISMIESGFKLILAGDEKVLNQLPKGDWLGGTIPYFLGENGGEFSTEKIYVDDITNDCVEVIVKAYGENELEKMVKDRFDNGFSVIALPALQPVHLKYSSTAHSFEGIYMNPIVGFIAGIALEEIGIKSPKVYNGKTGEVFENKAVLLHAKLENDKLARIEILNIFSENRESNDIITFDETSFLITTCKVNEEVMLLSDYIARENIDTKLPLITNFSGAKINVSVQSINDDGSVSLYAPVFKERKYKFAAPLSGDYVQEFEKGIADIERKNIAFSCNCILNYVYGELEGKDIGFTGPMTFGEVGYILLNQTLTYLIIE